MYYLLGDSLAQPHATPQAYQEAVTILHHAHAAGAAPDALWRLAGIAVWDGIPAAHAALTQMLQTPAPEDDRIVFDLDEDAEDTMPPAPVQYTMFA